MNRVLIAVFILGLVGCQSKTAITTPPTNPSNFHTTNVTNSSVTLAWDAVSGATGYVLERKTGTSAYGQIASPSSTTYTDTALSASTSYTYRLSAANGSLRSSGVVQTFSTLAAGTNPPPTAFKTQTIITGLDTPWSMRFAPDGRLLFTLRGDSVVSVHALDLGSGNLTTYSSTSAVLTYNISQSYETGVMGLELDPAFASNNKVYICYSYGDANNFHDRLSSFTLSGNSLTNEQVLLEMGGGPHHNGCRVIYGPDGKLYVGMGDNNTGSNAQDLSIMAGKIFRINPDGSIPSDNPFYNRLSGSSRAIWTFGHRNPQGLAFQPNTGVLWSTEHGPLTRDELNVIKVGKNYGWPLCSGTEAYGVPVTSVPDNTTYPCTGPNLTASNYQPAIREYSGGDGDSIAPSDLIFYTGSAFPAWQGSLFFVTLKTGRLYHLELSGQTVSTEEILLDYQSQGTRLRDIVQGPDGFIYISTDDGTIFRLMPK